MVSQGLKSQQIELWVAKLRSLVVGGSRQAIAQQVPALREELRQLAGDVEAEQTLGTQLQTILTQVAESLEPQRDLDAPLSDEQEQLRQMVEDFRPELTNLLATLDGQLTPEEKTLFKMTAELIENNCRQRQYENALQLLQQSWHKANEIQAEERRTAQRDEEQEQVAEEQEEEPIDLEPLVQAAARQLGNQLAPWGPVLTGSDQVQFAFYGTLLKKFLDAEEFLNALVLIQEWTNTAAALPAQSRERLISELITWEDGGDDATEPEWKAVDSACETIRQTLSGQDLGVAEILEAQRLLDLLPALIESTRAQIATRKGCRAAREQARKTLSESFAKIDKTLHASLQKALEQEAVLKDYISHREKKVAPEGYKAWLQELGEKVQAVQNKMTELAQALAKAAQEQETSEEETEDSADDLPHEIDSPAELLSTVPPLEGEDYVSYLEREAVTDFLGNNWLSQKALATLHQAFVQAEEDEVEDEGGGWTVTNDNPRVYFNDSAALDKAHRIIQKVKNKQTPQDAALGEGCSKPSWYGNMLEIRLTQGGTQLRLIANNLGNNQLEFTEIKSFHATGNSKLGYLNDYF